MNGGAANGDLLTRTTLRLEGAPSAVSLADLIRSLQRVPGVLVAEANARGDRALLAHDGAVPLSALLAAAAGLGVRATVERDPTAVVVTSAETVPVAPPMRVRAITMIGVAVFVVLGALDALVPAIRENRIVSVVLIGSVWSFFLLETYLNRKR